MNLALDGVVTPASPRIFMLFLRQRAVLATLGILLVIDAALIALTGWVEKPGQPERLDIILSLAPCVVPAVIGTAMWSRGADMEVNVPYPLRWPRLLHLAVLGVVGIAGSAIVVGSWMGRDETIHQGLYWTRYTLVALALALVATRFIGARFAWVAPMAMVVIVFMLRSRIETPAPHAYPWWLWVLRRTDDPMSWVCTGVVIVGAVALFAGSGPRPDDPGEA